MNNDIRWLISFTLSLLLWIFLPWFHFLFLILTLLHIPLLIRGIIDIRFNFFCKAYCHNKNRPTMCALTFDDGPDSQFTPKILDLLDMYNFKATFFVIANKALKQPMVVKECFSRGHTIACHDLHHKATSNFRLYKAMYNEIGSAKKIIASIIGKTPRLYRPPVGLTNPHLRKALRDLDMECVGWSSSVRDGGNRFSKTFSHLTELARPGSVILLHDTFPFNNSSELFLENLEKLFIKIKELKLEPVGIGELFDCKSYKEG